MEPGDIVLVLYEGMGVVESVTLDSINVRIDRDGVVVAAAHGQVTLISKVMK